MGLDVYLYKYEDFELSMKKEEEYEKRSDAIWKEVTKGREYGALTESEKDAARKRCDEVKAKIRLDDFKPERVTLKPKTKLPKDHIFEVGYFRSSYNESGIDSVLQDMGVPDLYEIFDVKRGEYHVKPDWRASLDRVNDAIKKFKANRLGYRSTELSIFDVAEGVVDCATATKKVKDHMDRKKDSETSFLSFMNRDGHFWLGEPIRVKAIIPGMARSRPAIYMVYEVDKAFYDWYLKALMVVRETIQHVLRQKDHEKYVFHWSG